MKRYISYSLILVDQKFRKRNIKNLNPTFLADEDNRKRIINDNRKHFYVNPSRNVARGNRRWQEKQEIYTARLARVVGATQIARVI